MTRICFHPASLRASESNVYLHTCVRIFVWLRQYSLRASLSGLAPFSRVVRPEIRCRGLRYAVVHFALAPRVSLRSPVRKSAVLDFGVPSVLHSISKFFEFLHSIARLHMGRSLRSAPPKSAVLDYWQLEVLPLVLFCFCKNSLVSNFYAGRAGCLSGTRRTCQNPLPRNDGE